ncbi:MAG: HAD family hydrolase, partial [Jatrophihabitantaceae bacterium]
RLVAAENYFWDRSRDQHLSFSLDDVFARAGFSPTAEALAAYHAFWDEHSFTDPAVPDLFAGLRARGIRVGVLSNTSWPRARHQQIFDRDGVAHLIDAAVYSSEIAYAKPHPEAFRAAMAAVGVADPASAVYVGDRLFDDIHGAHGAGMKAVHLPHSEIPERQIGAHNAVPDAVINSLGDLLPLVDSWRFGS